MLKLSMKTILSSFLIVFGIVIESSLNIRFPYAIVSLAFVNFLAYEKKWDSLKYTLMIAIIFSAFSSDTFFYILFFLGTNICLIYLYKILVIDELTMLLITFFEVVLYFLLIYTFLICDFVLFNIIVEYVLLFCLTHVFLKKRILADRFWYSNIFFENREKLFQILGNTNYEIWKKNREKQFR